MLTNKVLLITGGTGSFGNALIEYILDNKINYKEIRVFSRDEKKQEDLRKKHSKKNIHFILGDVRDISSLNNAVKRVDYIFHAAAYKQVPSCEFYPLEAVKTNVLGTENVLQKAIENKVKRVVCLSTDKAVYPINAMGISKAMMEKVAVSRSLNNQNTTDICITRYGNVLASRGSVIPLFVDQIINKKPITVTDLAMTRFLMPMNKAIELVLFALKNGKNGDTFVQKTSAATIKDILTAILEIFKKPNYKVEIIGTRHGEKKYESLLTREEMARANDLGDYFRISKDDRDLNYDSFFLKGNKKISKFSDYNSDNTIQLSVTQIKKILLTLDIFKKIKLK
jgi:UDP-glucose 4-epimerase